MQTDKIFELTQEIMLRNNVRSTLFLCSSYRSGSSFVGELLASQGFGGLDKERFNNDFIEKYPIETSSSTSESIIGEELFAKFLIDFEEKVRISTTRQGIFATKMMWPDKVGLFNLLCLNGMKYADLCNVFPNLEFVFVYRDDIIAQTVSFWRAKKTNLWHVYDEEVIRDQPEPDYFFEELLASFKELLTTKILWESFFEYLGVEPVSIKYSDIQDPIKIIKKCVAELKCTRLLDSQSIFDFHVNLMKQRDMYSSSIKARFTQDLLSLPFSKLI